MLSRPVSGSDRTGRFNEAQGITNDSISESLENIEKLTHPELLGLRWKICALLGYDPGGQC